MKSQGTSKAGEKKRSFPCPICKGQGGWKEVVLDDGSGPFDECGYCEGKGLIEIGGKLHREKKAFQIAFMIIDFVKPTQEEFSYDELLKIGYKALDLVK